MDFVELIDICLNADLPFALYRMPGENEILLLISKSNAENIAYSDLKNIGKGFVLHPLKESKENPIWFLKTDIMVSSKDENISDHIVEYINGLEIKDGVENLTSVNHDIKKTDYLSRVEYLIDKINKGDLSKVVFSRTKTINTFKKKELKNLFFKMEQKYNDAFVFLVNIQGVFSWCGATPELLLSSENKGLKTVALAGTQKYDEGNISNYKWGNKEIEEQKFVCDHIEGEIRKVGFQYTKTEPLTIRAGGVIHIQTKYFIEGEKDKFWDLVSMLHPTPAVCGTPMNKALQLIEEFEQYNRSYYTGFLGPVDIKSERNLFVNLRCAKYSNESLNLYVGGGITGQSIPIDEWEETELKADTLIKLL
jgi:isochorismate synthase